MTTTTAEQTEPSIYERVVHPRIEERHKLGAPTTAKIIARHASRNLPAKFNAWLAVKITGMVGTMWCAYVFGAVALIGLPAAIGLSWVPSKAGSLVLWISSEFIQLVLLAVIMVGQNIAAASSDARAIATYKDAEAILATASGLETHLQQQDTRLALLIAAQEKVLADLKDTASRVSTQLNAQADSAAKHAS